MRTNLSSRNYRREATGPASPAAADVSPVASESHSQHWLPQAPTPRTDAAKNASKSRRGLLSSACKSLATLRKRLPSMCLGAPVTDEATQPPGRPTASDDASKSSLRSPMPHTGRDAQSPACAQIPSCVISPRSPTRQQRSLAVVLATERVQVWPSRTEETWQQQNAAPHQRHRPPAPQGQASSARVTDRMSDSEYEKDGDGSLQQPAPGQIGPDRGRQWQRSFQDEPPSPETSSGSTTPSSPTLSNYSTLLSKLNAQLEPYHHWKYQIDTRGDRPLTTEEHELLQTRKVLIDQRNKIRDIQLDGMLEALAPMEKINPPQTTTSRVSLVQYKVIDANRRAFSAVKDKKLDMGLIAREYARAQRDIEPLRNSGAAYSKIKRLERMMEGYQNWRALQRMVTHINDQLEDMGGPQLTDSDPSTPRERQDAAREELELQQEAMENGYW